MKEGYKETPIGMIPEDWDCEATHQHIELLSGFPFKSEQFNTLGNGTKLLRGINITVGKLRWNSQIDRWWEEHFTEYDKYSLKEGDLVISMDGSLVGHNYARVPKEDLPLLLVQRVACLRAKDTLDLEFLHQLIGSPIFINYVDAVKTSSGIPHISAKQIKEFQIPLPPKSEQSKIASILSTVDDKIESINERIKETQKLKQGLIQQLLTRGIGHTRFKDSPLGEIPESWETKNISSIATVVRGASPRPKGDPRYYGGEIPRLMVEDVTRDGKYVTPKVDFLTDEGASRSRYMKSGTLVMVCSGTVGIPAFLSVDACVHDGFLAFPEIFESFSKDFLYYIFVSLKEKFNSSATHGGVFTNLTTTIIKEFLIVAPPYNEQLEIAQILSSFDEKLDNLAEIKNENEQLKKGLMQQLLTGKLRVTI